MRRTGRCSMSAGSGGRSFLTHTMLSEVLCMGPRTLVTVAGGLFIGLAASASTSAEQLHATFIGNAAFHVTDGRLAVLTDFPYESGAFGYMTWSSTAVPSGPAPLCIISHSHADHFAADRAAALCGSILGPRDVVRDSGVEVVELQPEVRWQGITIRAFRTPHASVEHYSFLLEWAGKRVYFAGDTADTGTLLAARELDAAFVTPWLLEAVHETGRRIDARQVIVCHHRVGQTVAEMQGRIVPSQGQVLSLGEQ
ncbi:MAG: hypothetical protein GEU99_12095 [Luteitalea sp.]|nr:hypothetical protein [Luteitalea sp.]